ncbi:hypothetical protein DICA1_E29976 [Diutina catenulata]
MSRTKLLVTLAVAATVAAMEMGGSDEDNKMLMPDERPEFHPINAGSKTAHWIFTLAILVVLQSVAAAFALADRMRWSVGMQLVCTGYSVIESLFLRFPDNQDNHENRTSVGTSWFLSMWLGATVFIGTLLSGSNALVNKFYPHLADNAASARVLTAYKWLSSLGVLVGFIRTCLSVTALFGFCYGKHTGQCIAHGIMGTAFITYGGILLILLLIPWIRKHQLASSDPSRYYSQEFWDSTVIMLWGIVNTFTEHRWGEEPWWMGDYQHTAMGIIWWCGGLLGMWLSRGNRRSWVPSVILIFTGWSMSEHVQHSVISTKVHLVFGMALMLAGLTRIIETSFLLEDRATTENGKIRNFQYMPPFCLVMAGLSFMSANEEQLELVHNLGSDHSAYILVVAGAAFLIYLWFNLVVTLYLWLVGYSEDGEMVPDTFTRLEREADFELDDMSEDERLQT